MHTKIVPDTSVVINGKLTEYLQSEESKGCEVIIPVAVVDELQAQASKKREPGFIGLNELKRIRDICAEKNIPIRFSGERPSLEDIKLARSGRIDALIRDVAKAEGATLYTSDYVQALVAEAEGISVRYIPVEPKRFELSFERYFTHEMLSLHLKEGAPPMAKVGKPGNLTLTRLRDEPCTQQEISEMINEIIEAARSRGDSSIEIVRSGALVIQLGPYRIAIARPPFSDGLELTIVRPIVKLTLEDYHLSQKLIERLRSRAEGILIAGQPGSGKTTFASSLAEFYARQGKIVKTLESPRDLQVGPEVTQYGPLEGDFEKTAEILLLVRPDYTVFDEIRKGKDFQVFADMRLAGVGMIGVVHASNPVDAIQRFIGRVELGMIPHIIDTVIFLKDGEVKQVYELSLIVKVPTGMVEADLARPVVEVRDFETGRLEYEIYTFGDENVIVPVSDVKQKLSGIKDRVLAAVSRFDPNARVEVVSTDKAIVRVSKESIPRLIGRKGETIRRLEEELGIRLDVELLAPTMGEEVRFKVVESGKTVDVLFDEDIIGKTINIYVEGEHLLTAVVGKKGRVRVSKSSSSGKALMSALVAGKEIKVFRT
ncbi:MAG: ATPase [Candidatus Terraquivivens tikiterensis]|uniref:ATPase n=1 Tax=Candidatus Terraquivivens tikiterensis TaxID=1980982 RepID=A0A2R7Y567_9ARCH|nr:MAG: ATPase [Candidatus Terraquivivens tikiterensis]